MQQQQPTTEPTSPIMVDRKGNVVDYDVKLKRRIIDMVRKTDEIEILKEVGKLLRIKLD